MIPGRFCSALGGRGARGDGVGAELAGDRGGGLFSAAGRDAAGGGGAGSQVTGVKKPDWGHRASPAEDLGFSQVSAPVARPPCLMGVANLYSMSHGKWIHLFCLNSFTQVSTMGRPEGFGVEGGEVGLGQELADDLGGSCRCRRGRTDEGGRTSPSPGTPLRMLTPCPGPGRRCCPRRRRSWSAQMVWMRRDLEFAGDTRAAGSQGPRAGDGDDALPRCRWRGARSER